MVWKFVSNGGKSQTHFDSKLLSSIREKSNEQLESTLQNAKNLYTAVDSLGDSLLHYAAHFNNKALALTLLESGAKIDLQNEKGQTPLMLATKGQHEETIRVLLEHDADIYIEDNNGVSPLQLAVKEILMSPSITEIFLNHLKTNWSSFEVGRRLLKINCPINIAVRSWDLDVVKHMLSEQSPVDAADPKTNQTALHLAVLKGDVEMIKVLIDRGANVNALDSKNQTPLSLIRNFEHTEILEMLAKKGVEMTTCTEDGVMQLYWVLTTGTSKAVEVVLQSGIDFKAKDVHEQTLMHYLTKNTNEGIIESVKEWIDGKEEPKDFIDSMFLNLKDSETIVSKVEIDWNAKDKDGRTPLHNAMAIANSSFVEYLIKKGADVNVKTAEGVTLFFEALESSSLLEERVKCVKLVMDRGAYPTVDIERYLKTHNTKLTINRDFPLLEPVLANLVLRQVKGENISEKLLESIDCHSKLKDYVAACKVELDQIKNAKVCRSFNLFDFLTETEKTAGFYMDVYLKLDELIENYKFGSYYSCILQQRFSRLANDMIKQSMNFVEWFAIWSFILFVMFTIQLFLVQCGLDFTIVSKKMFSILFFLGYPILMILINGLETTYLRLMFAFKAFSAVTNKYSNNEQFLTTRKA